MSAVISEETFDDLLHATLEHLIAHGRLIAPTKGAALEDTAVLLQLANPRSRLSRSAKRSTIVSCIGELAWYLSGSDDEETIAYYVPQYRRYAVGGKLLGAYGPRLFGGEGGGQVSRVISLLRSRPDTRQAVIQIFHQGDLANDLLDLPCTCTLQFFVRESRLALVVTMRSNDAFVGLTHDLFAFTMIQELVAVSLGLDLGTYSHFVGSLHLYNSDRDRADAYLEDGWYFGATASMPPMPVGDPWNSVRSFCQMEASIRTTPPDQISVDGIGRDYWGDLSRMLAAYRLKRTRPDSLDELVAALADEFFEIYLTDRAFKE
ncbi:thymidylate synthase [Microbacterium sp. X-17]|uniref:thymidylate synthase n=1 Tax=Microbacterium sp. X-17 TaxID=3144404 RepID=UPI0031F58129